MNKRALDNLQYIWYGHLISESLVGWPPCMVQFYFHTLLTTSIHVRDGLYLHHQTFTDFRNRNYGLMVMLSRGVQTCNMIMLITSDGHTIIQRFKHSRLFD